MLDRRTKPRAYGSNAKKAKMNVTASLIGNMPQDAGAGVHRTIQVIAAVIAPSQKQRYGFWGHVRHVQKGQRWKTTKWRVVARGFNYFRGIPLFKLRMGWPLVIDPLPPQQVRVLAPLLWSPRLLPGMIACHRSQLRKDAQSNPRWAKDLPLPYSNYSCCSGGLVSLTKAVTYQRKLQCYNDARQPVPTLSRRPGRDGTQAQEETPGQKGRCSRITCEGATSFLTMTSQEWSSCDQLQDNTRSCWTPTSGDATECWGSSRISNNFALDYQCELSCLSLTAMYFDMYFSCMCWCGTCWVTELEVWIFIVCWMGYLLLCIVLKGMN